MTTIDKQSSGRGSRSRRHLLVAGFVLAYLAAGGVTLPPARDGARLRRGG